jgi:Fe-S-cluster containining protein
MRTISFSDINKLLKASENQQQVLKQMYSLLPQTRCHRKADCCSMLPEMTLLEAISVMRLLADMPAPMRIQLIKRIAEYFFVNAVEITACPFLKGQECVIYQSRVLGCRTYGLWSQKYYLNLANQNRKAKQRFQQQWRKIGIKLPQAVIDFQLPYCLAVETLHGSHPDDGAILKIVNSVARLSRSFTEMNQVFQQQYFSDLSFLVAALIYGFGKAIRMKYDVVKEYVTSGSKEKMNRLINLCPDVFNGPVAHQPADHCH